MTGEVTGGIELKKAYKEGFKVFCVWELSDRWCHVPGKPRRISNKCTVHSISSNM